MTLEFTIEQPSEELIRFLFPNKRKFVKEEIFKTIGKKYYSMALSSKLKLIKHIQQTFN